MSGISGLNGIWAATKADTLSLTAFEVGLFAWMAFSLFGMVSKLPVNNLAYWSMMQINSRITVTSSPM